MTHFRNGCAWPQRVRVSTIRATAIDARPTSDAHCSVRRSVIVVSISSKRIRSEQLLFGGLGDANGDRQVGDAGLLAGPQRFGHALEFAPAVAADQHAQGAILLLR